MSMIYVLLPLSLVLAGIAVGVFIWAAKKGQFDDLETPAHRVLLDDRDESDGEEVNSGATDQRRGENVNER